MHSERYSSIKACQKSKKKGNIWQDLLVLLFVVALCFS
jgi:hypothetical protein